MVCRTSVAFARYVVTNFQSVAGLPTLVQLFRRKQAMMEAGLSLIKEPKAE